MKSISNEAKVRDNAELVKEAQRGSLGAYDEIVHRFQHIAVGYAYSLTGDFQLAEDAAQEAFIEAYCDLPNLRNPEAFAGWLRKIVFKQCDRIWRRKQLAVASLDEVIETACEALAPAGILERQLLRDSVREAISELPEQQRTVVLLFYMRLWSQQEIAQFLEVPLHTVKNRLHAARLKLKQRMIMNFDELQETPAAPDQSLANRVMDLIRAAQEGNIEQVQNLLNQKPELAREQPDGTTALHFASWFAHPQIARLLVLHGADLNLRDGNHNSPPIGWAHESGQHEMVEFLLELGAQINICQAAGLGKLERVQQMLEEDPSLINFRSGWGSPLHEAAGWGHLHVAEYLLTHGANIHLINERGETPLDVAMKQQNGACCTPYLPEKEKLLIVAECAKIEQLLRRQAEAS